MQVNQEFQPLVWWGGYSLPRRMLISRLPFKMVHPWSIWADVTESMVFVFFSSSPQTLGQGPSQGIQYMLGKIKECTKNLFPCIKKKKHKQIKQKGGFLFVITAAFQERTMPKHPNGRAVSPTQGKPSKLQPHRGNTYCGGGKHVARF